MKPSVLRFLNLLCCALLTGGLALLAVAVRPAVAAVPLSAGALVHQLWVPRLVVYLPPLGIIGVTSAVFLIKSRLLSPESARFYKLGIACMVLVGLMSLYIGGVLDEEIGRWPLAGPDGRTLAVGLADLGARASEVWNRWAVVNATRTVFAVLALSCFILANVQEKVFAREA
jgi:hypothetical protein